MGDNQSKKTSPNRNNDEKHGIESAVNTAKQSITENLGGEANNFDQNRQTDVRKIEKQAEYTLNKYLVAN